MSVAAEIVGGPPVVRLRVIHSKDSLPQQPTAARVAAQVEELPLRWAIDRDGEAAAGVLARHPALPLDLSVPRPEPFVAHAATIVADVLAGARPATQLGRCASLEVQQRLGRRAALRPSRREWSGRPARVSSTSTMVVGGTAVQVVVVFFIGPRAHAAAIRMEYRHRRWLVTDVQSPA